MGKVLSQITFDFATEENSLHEPETEKITSIKKPARVEEKMQQPSAQQPQKRDRKSLKEISEHACLLQVPDEETLYKKQYYPIGEVAAMFRENQSLIRYWETEFDILKPRKNRKGDRFFRPVDIQNLVMIYDLLRRRKYTIEGAKTFLKNNKSAREKFDMIQSLEKIKNFFLELKANL